MGGTAGGVEKTNKTRVASRLQSLKEKPAWNGEKWSMCVFRLSVSSLLPIYRRSRWLELGRIASVMWLLPNKASAEACFQTAAIESDHGCKFGNKLFFSAQSFSQWFNHRGRGEEGQRDRDSLGFTVTVTASNVRPRQGCSQLHSASLMFLWTSVTEWLHPSV